MASLAARYMARRGWDVAARLPTPGQADNRQSLVHDLASRVERLVVVGGDGTLRETVAALQAREHRPTLGFVPIGNANVLARELAVPRDPRAAVRLLTTGRPLAVDAATVKPPDGRGQTTFFLAMLEIGFGAAVVHTVHRWRHGFWQRAYRVWGDLFYVLAAARALTNLKRAAFEIRVDDHAPLRACRHAVIANTRTYAKGWTMTPQASPTDGLLDLAGRQRADIPSLVQSYRNARCGRETRGRDVFRARARRLTITAHRPLWLQADGDPLPALTRLRVAILPRAMHILVPAGTPRDAPNPAG